MKPKTRRKIRKHLCRLIPASIKRKYKAKLVAKMDAKLQLYKSQLASTQRLRDVRLSFIQVLREFTKKKLLNPTAIAPWKTIMSKRQNKHAVRIADLSAQIEKLETKIRRLKREPGQPES